MHAIQDAELNVGVREEGHNDGPAVNTYLGAVGIAPYSHQAWCAAFVVYRICNAAHKLNLAVQADWPRSGWCPDHVAWAKHHNLWLPAKRWQLACRGDVVCFWFDAKERVAHVGLLAQVDQTGVPGYRLVTVEGNTGPAGTAGAVEREGDGVYRKARSIASLGSGGGFIRLPF
jgi:hypothetical protein